MPVPKLPPEELERDLRRMVESFHDHGGDTATDVFCAVTCKDAADFIASARRVLESVAAGGGPDAGAALAALKRVR